MYTHMHTFGTRIHTLSHVLRLVVSQVPSQARCLGKVKPVPLVLVLVEVSPWVEAEAGSLDHLAPEETASLAPLGLEGHHHTSLVSLVTSICASVMGTLRNRIVSL